MSMREKQAARKNKRAKHVTEPRHITRAATRIRLTDVNAGKLAALDTLAPVYLTLCQQYVTFFCTEELPDKLRDPLYETPLSERRHRVAMMQAAGIAKSWRSNRANALRDYEKQQEQYQQRLAAYQEQKARGMREKGEEEIKEPKAPVWHEWNTPTLREWCLQTNANVAKLEPSEDSSFDYWLTVATLSKGYPIKIPVKLADYHKEALKEKKLNSSVSLNKRNAAWWLTVTYDEDIAIATAPDAPVGGFQAHADHNAAINLSRRVGDKALGACHGRDAIKSLLLKRHEAWKQEHGFAVSPRVKSRKRKRFVSSGRSLVM
ncbi:MAG TPA: hypothetical protein VKY19_04020 [Ktedonosporobacter sp.]|jgi:hypothetical protein|nr:hypothetical protein [Ktedonosporobacter sp.]